MEKIMPLTRDSLGPLVEQPEPTTTGDAYVVPIEDLYEMGYRYISINFPDDSDTPDGVTLYADE